MRHMSKEEKSKDIEVEKATQAEEAPQLEIVSAGDPVPASAEEDTSTLTIDSDVVGKIVAITCRSVDGILQMKGNFISSLQEGLGGTDITKGVQVEMVGDDACIVSVSIIMEYGKSAKKIYTELHDRITEKIEDMAGLKVKAVNVRVVDVMTREEVEGRKGSVKAEKAAGGKGKDRADQDDADDGTAGDQGSPSDSGEADAVER